MKFFLIFSVNKDLQTFDIWNSQVNTAITVLCYISSCANPITYCFLNKKFRTALLITFGCMRKTLNQKKKKRKSSTVYLPEAAMNTSMQKKSNVEITALQAERLYLLHFCSKSFNIRNVSVDQELQCIQLRMQSKFNSFIVMLHKYCYYIVRQINSDKRSLNEYIISSFRSDQNNQSPTNVIHSDAVLQPTASTTTADRNNYSALAKKDGSIHVVVNEKERRNLLKATVIQSNISSS